MVDGGKLAEELCGVRENESKQEVFSPEGDLSCMPASLRGAPQRRAKEQGV